MTLFQQKHKTLDPKQKRRKNKVFGDSRYTNCLSKVFMFFSPSGPSRPGPTGSGKDWDSGSSSSKLSSSVNLGVNKHTGVAAQANGRRPALPKHYHSPCTAYMHGLWARPLRPEIVWCSSESSSVVQPSPGCLTELNIGDPLSSTYMCALASCNMWSSCS